MLKVSSSKNNEISRDTGFINIFWAEASFLSDHVIYPRFTDDLQMIYEYFFSADLSSQNTKMENSMGSSFDRSDSISDDDETQDVFVLPEEDSELENAKELNNIKRILNECRVLYKSKVDHHNRKVFI